MQSPAHAADANAKMSGAFPQNRIRIIAHMRSQSLFIDLTLSRYVLLLRLQVLANQPVANTPKAYVKTACRLSLASAFPHKLHHFLSEIYAVGHPTAHHYFLNKSLRKLFGMAI
jgi:hypothetical protein